MPFSVAVLDEAGYSRLTSTLATRLVSEAFSQRGFEVDHLGEISVALVEPDVIHDLNLKFRNKDKPTDVLSFEVDGPYGEMVGEVVICPHCASPEMGVEELVVHGALHLGGMDHGEDFEPSEMAGVQRAVMEELRGQEG
jgi:probable rRNA maturation factor